MGIGISGCLMKIFLAFSVYSNGKKLLSTKKTPGTLGAVNGVRVLSISWVILGHVFAFVISVVCEYPCCRNSCTE